MKAIVKKGCRYSRDDSTTRELSDVPTSIGLAVVKSDELSVEQLDIPFF